MQQVFAKGPAATGSSATPHGQRLVSSLLLIGDSITAHAPAAHIGWGGNWGMAATSEDKDYAHLLISYFEKMQNMKPELHLHARGGGTIIDKLNDADNIRALASAADLIVIQLGENDRDASRDVFYKNYEQLIALVRSANPAARIICTGVWSPSAGSPVKDGYIRELCSKYSLSFADLSAANKVPENRASATGLWENSGVGWHPSDSGMEAYAKSIWQAYLAGDAVISK